MKSLIFRVGLTGCILMSIFSACSVVPSAAEQLENLEGRWELTANIARSGYRLKNGDTDFGIAIDLTRDQAFTQTITLYPSNRTFISSGRWEVENEDQSIRLLGNLYAFALFENEGKAALCSVRQIESRLDLCGVAVMRICSPVGGLYMEIDTPLKCYEYPSAGFVRLYQRRTRDKQPVLALTYPAPSIEAAPLNLSRK
jgi:hypothetical protein